MGIHYGQRPRYSPYPTKTHSTVGTRVSKVNDTQVLTPRNKRFLRSLGLTVI